MWNVHVYSMFTTKSESATCYRAGSCTYMKTECNNNIFFFRSCSVVVIVVWFFFPVGLISWECLPFKSILCIVKGVERQHVLSEQFLIQNAVLVKDLKLSGWHEDLKYYNKNHPVAHKITAHFQRNLILMLMESIKLTGRELKLVTDFAQKDRGKIEVPTEETGVLWANLSAHFFLSAELANEAVTCTDL